MLSRDWLKSLVPVIIRDTTPGKSIPPLHLGVAVSATEVLRLLQTSEAAGQIALARIAEKREAEK